MRVTILVLVLFVVSGVFTTAGWAQGGLQAGGNLLLGLPQNEFKENVDNAGFGLTGHFAYRFPQTPVLVGANLSFLIYGSETRNEPFSTTIPDVTVDVTTTNSILLGHLLLRLQPQTGPFRPYVDGLLGLNYLFTDTSIKSENWSDDDNDVASSTNFDDTTLSYGGGGGIMVQVYQSPVAENAGRPVTVFLDFGVRYLKGGEAEYLQKGAIIREENGRVVYDVSQSTTDLLTFQVGAVVSF
jgi:hypothetical protein